MRQWFGCERYDTPEVWPLMNTLCRGPLNQLFNYFLPTMKLESKERVEGRTRRKYGKTTTPLSRVLACAEVSEETRAQLRSEKKNLNPIALCREVSRQMKEIDQHRQLSKP